MTSIDYKFICNCPTLPPLPIIAHTCQQQAGNTLKAITLYRGLLIYDSDAIRTSNGHVVVVVFGGFSHHRCF